MNIFWDARDRSETYTVVPGENCVIGVQVRGRISRVEGERTEALRIAGITGVLTGPRTFYSQANTKSLLIQIPPLLLSRRISVPMNEIKDASLSLEDLFTKSEVSQLLEDCEEANENVSVSSWDASLVFQKFWKNKELKEDSDTYLIEAMQRIRSSAGELGIRSLAEDLGVSQSTLERGFKARVGINPKEFASLVRFRKALEGLGKTESLTELAYGSGYYDQAHFIREFKKKTGTSPKKWNSLNI
ncbi:AraC family transcriptional regulator [Leptospira langatensis]|uniref:AraC family transcriptional regulator n=1 Tax=Leptospira langatensis TaxID=2484983 RepID=A0A5F1ZUZ4_9LEPT|nr:helix-turn-helix domain-containing protein [Leptospira langatensis]TGK01190.1 AraC family transcriptional regulator [Leptospira langatensis]TGL42359.1 AraC family transcriptional regulator [Leptospira langatensis]